MRRHAPYNVHPQVIPDADAVHESAQPAQAAPVYQATPQPQARPKSAPQPEPRPNAFHVTPGWIDTADRTRTWNLMDRNGGKLAEITTKRDAEKLANILNRVREANVGRGR